MQQFVEDMTAASSPPTGAAPTGNPMGAAEAPPPSPEGAPRIHLIGLRFVEGLAIRVEGGGLDVDDCFFDGNRTHSSTRYRQGV